MFTRHKLKGPVRSYLLGQLDDDQAAVLEDRYFSDPAVFRWVRDVEAAMIAEYLKGELSASERERFEQRYLEVPELKKRLEEVRRNAPVTQPVLLHMRWQFVLTAVVLVCCGLSWLVWRGAGDRRAPIAQGQPPNPPVVALAVHLVPGLVKGAKARQVEFTPPPGGRVRLSLELPGRNSPLACRVAIALVAPDGGRGIAWTSQPVLSSAVGTGQEVVVELAASLLPPGDYVGEVVTSAGGVLETYSFRVPQ